MIKPHISEAEHQTFRAALLALDAAEAGPDAATLAAAPVLTRWQAILLTPNLCLAGEVTGHPLLEVDFITTSPLIVLAEDLGWARTLSRFYRLGPALEINLAKSLAEVGHTTPVILDAYGWPAVRISDARRYVVELHEVIRRMAGEPKELRN